MKAMNVIGTIILALSMSVAANAKLDSKGATVRMNVAKYAKITGLDDFTLITKNEDGSAKALYSGSDQFQLESNCAVQVDMEGEKLSNGVYSLATSYQLDSGTSISTEKGVHNKEHQVSAQALLGNISSQEAGDYSAKIVLTVSAIE